MIYGGGVAGCGTGDGRRGLRRARATGEVARHWPTRHRSRDELEATRPRQPASTYVNK